MEPHERFIFTIVLAGIFMFGFLVLDLFRIILSEMFQRWREVRNMGKHIRKGKKDE